MTELKLKNVSPKVTKKILQEAGYPTPECSLWSDRMEAYVAEQVDKRVTTEVLARGHKKALVRFYLDGEALSVYTFKNGKMARAVSSNVLTAFYYATRFDTVSRPNAQTTHYKVSNNQETDDFYGETLCGRHAPKSGWEYTTVKKECPKCKRIRDNFMKRPDIRMKKLTQAEIDRVNSLLNAT